MTKLVFVGMGAAHEMMCRFLNARFASLIKHGESHWVGRVVRGDETEEVEIFWVNCPDGVVVISDWMIVDATWESMTRCMAIGRPQRDVTHRIMRVAKASDLVLREKWDGSGYYDPIPDIAAFQLAAVICPTSRKRRT